MLLQFMEFFHGIYRYLHWKCHLLTKVNIGIVFANSIEAWPEIYSSYGQWTVSVSWIAYEQLVFYRVNDG